MYSTRKILSFKDNECFAQLSRSSRKLSLLRKVKQVVLLLTVLSVSHERADQRHRFREYSVKEAFLLPRVSVPEGAFNALPLPRNLKCFLSTQYCSWIASLRLRVTPICKLDLFPRMPRKGRRNFRKERGSTTRPRDGLRTNQISCQLQNSLHFLPFWSSHRLTPAHQ